MPVSANSCPIPVLEPDTQEERIAKMAYIMRFGLQAPFTGKIISNVDGKFYTVVMIPTYATC